jgi:antitoxin (DNA-binding transcriptional repressor) of toxin-antitoxin stability system
METMIAAEQFQATCLDWLDTVHEERISLLITRRGKPIARLIAADAKPVALFGALRGTVKAADDLISPIGTNWNIPS